MAVDLNPWVEYEFRVVASNAIGTGDPSAPSRGVRTKEAGKSHPPTEKQLGLYTPNYSIKVVIKMQTLFNITGQHGILNHDEHFGFSYNIKSVQ